MFSDLILARARREQHTGPFRVVESGHNVIVIFAVKLDIEHKAVGEPNPHPGNMGGVECIVGEHGEDHCFSALLLDLHSPAYPSALHLPLRISKTNTL
jgi:hypothetical protein